MMNQTLDKSISYTSNIKYFNIFEKILKMNPNYTPGDFRKCGLEKDIDRFYSLFPSLTREEVNEMMYSFEIFIAFPKAYKEAYEKTYGVTLSADDKKRIKDDAKLYAFSYLARVFYANLSENANMSLEEIFENVTSFENNILRNNINVNDSKFSEYYVNVRNAFFDSLSMNASNEEIPELYYSFNANAIISTVNNSNIKE